VDPVERDSGGDSNIDAADACKDGAAEVVPRTGSRARSEAGAGLGVGLGVRAESGPSGHHSSPHACQLWQTPAVRLAAAEAAAAAAAAAGNVPESLRRLFEAAGLAHVHRATVAAMGGQLSRAEVTGEGRVHLKIAEAYEESSRSGDRGGGGSSAHRRDDNDNDSGDDSDGDGWNVGGGGSGTGEEGAVGNLEGIARSAAHLQSAIAASAPCAEAGGAAAELALAKQCLAARRKLAPQLLVLGRHADAAVGHTPRCSFKPYLRLS